MKPWAFRTKYYWRVWWKGIGIHFSVLSAIRLDFVFFFIGKISRTVYFFIFFLSALAISPVIAGYDSGQVMLFLATMNLIDITIQILWFRGLTEFPAMIRRGDFDLLLTQPISPLFMTAFRIFDFFDLTTVPIAIAMLWYAFAQLPSLSAGAWILYLTFCVVGLTLAFAINLFFATLTFWTVESGNLWWIFRDLMYVARMPPEVFPRGVRLFFTFIFPILMIVSFPVKAALGLLSPASAAVAILIASVALVASLKFWHRGLRAYSSASS